DGSGGFTHVFNRHPSDVRTIGEIRDAWKKSRASREALSVLVANGLLPSEDEVSPFLVSREKSGFFYITDRPDTGNVDEVFSLHLEQRAFSDRLLARRGDTVLDLGTGCGVL